MNMWRVMVFPIKAYYDAKESTNFRHNNYSFNSDTNVTN